MRFAAIVMSIVLTVMTGVVLNQFWSLEQTPAPSIQTSSDSGVQETAMAFYDAVNTYLESGAERAIRERLHPAFATHRPGSD